MDQLVVDDEFVIGVQSPVASSQACGLSNDVKSNDVSVSVDIPEDPPLQEERDHVLVASSSVGKPRTTDKPKGVFQVTTTVLTQENIRQFFTPKWSAPRTKEQRLAAPRSTVL